MINRPSLFFSTKGLTRLEMIEICRKAHAMSTSWRVDTKDVHKSWARQPAPHISFEQSLDYIYKDCHFTVVHRTLPFDGEAHKDFGEVGFCTMNREEDIFLWIYMTLDSFYQIIKEYSFVWSTDYTQLDYSYKSQF